MAEESSVAPENQALTQGLIDLRQTWEHLARELAGGVPELPAVIDQELTSLNLDDLNEETLIRVTEAVVARVAAAGFPDEAAVLLRRMGRALYELLLLLATQEEIREMKPPAFAPEVPAPQLTVLRPSDGDGLDPFDLLEVELEPEQVSVPKPQPSPNGDGNLTGTESSDSDLPPSDSPEIAPAREPRDPIRPAAAGIAATRAPAPAPESPSILEVAAVMAPTRMPTARSITIPPPPEVPIEAPSTPSSAPAMPLPPEPTLTTPPPPAAPPTTTIPPDVPMPPPAKPRLAPPPPPAPRPTTTIPPDV
ncbi:MAG TPA: hypothetical protein VMV09_07360, partial [Candidatus Saccharimonadales bacterium]|nr:hypothetical protein [Candidatus Saccharimonadales bacterium]